MSANKIDIEATHGEFRAAILATTVVASHNDRLVSDSQSTDPIRETSQYLSDRVESEGLDAIDGPCRDDTITVTLDFVMLRVIIASASVVLKHGSMDDATRDRLQTWINLHEEWKHRLHSQEFKRGGCHKEW